MKLVLLLEFMKVLKKSTQNYNQFCDPVKVTDFMVKHIVMKPNGE